MGTKLKIAAAVVLLVGTGLLLRDVYDQITMAAMSKARPEVSLISPLTFCSFVALILVGGGLAFFRGSYGASLLLGGLGTFFAFWAFALVSAGVGM